MIQRELVLKKLKELKNELNDKFSIEKIALFGSVARDEATENSDIDITILKMKKKDYFKRAKAVYFLEKELNQKVDLGYFDSIRNIIQMEIKKDMIYV